MVNDIGPQKPRKKVKKQRPAVRQPKFKTKKEPGTFQEPVFMPPDRLKDSEHSSPAAAEKPPSVSRKTARFGKDTEKKPKRKINFPPIVWVMKKWSSFSRLQKFIVAGVIAVLIGGSASAAVWYWPQPPIVEPRYDYGPYIPPVPEPTTEPSNLTGLEVGFDVNKRPVIGVMIENSPDARPQSGLINAGVVFEAVAEGGITRFLALFQDEQPKTVGPVRSARPYYISWLLGFDAAYGHAGGSATALSQIRSFNVKDLDQFANAGSYERVSHRYAPHNLYTGIDRLTSLARSKGYSSSDYSGFARKEDAKAETPSARSIEIDISSSLYDVKYAYDTTNNAYLRLMAGKPHKDEKSGKQINPKVVVVMVLDKGIASNGIHTTYKTLGSGKVFVFQDGRVQQGTWSKSNNTSQIIFKDKKGKVLKLNAGKTWITMVGNANAVTHKP